MQKVHGRYNIGLDTNCVIRLIPFVSNDLAWICIVMLVHRLRMERILIWESKCIIKVVLEMKLKKICDINSKHVISVVVYKYCMIVRMVGMKVLQLLRDHYVPKKSVLSIPVDISTFKKSVVSNCMNSLYCAYHEQEHASLVVAFNDYDVCNAFSKVRKSSQWNDSLEFCLSSVLMASGLDACMLPLELSVPNHVGWSLKNRRKVHSPHGIHDLISACSLVPSHKRVICDIGVGYPLNGVESMKDFVWSFQEPIVQRLSSETYCTSSVAQSGEPDQSFLPGNDQQDAIHVLSL